MAEGISLNYNNGIFTEFFTLLGKVGKRVKTTPEEKRRIIKYGLPLNGKIKDIISIVNYSTFRRWVTDGLDNKKRETKKVGRPRITTEEIRQLIVRLAKENNWLVNSFPLT